jgi:hypothetical protein
VLAVKRFVRHSARRRGDAIFKDTPWGARGVTCSCFVLENQNAPDSLRGLVAPHTATESAGRAGAVGHANKMTAHSCALETLVGREKLLSAPKVLCAFVSARLPLSFSGGPAMARSLALAKIMPGHDNEVIALPQRLRRARSGDP